jgi:hypothetical protein
VNLICFGIFSTTLMNDQSLSYLNRMKKQSEIIHISNIKIYPHCQNIYMCKTHENQKVTNKIAILRPEALKSLYRSPGYKKNQLVLCKNYVLQW